MDQPPETALEQASIDNVVLFVADAVRYDAVDRLGTDLGHVHKTIAASLHTPASFASMLTGRNVPGHGVTGFRNVLPDSIRSMMDLEGYNCYFSNKTGTMHADLHRIFRHEPAASIDDVEEPFVFVVRDPGGHAPYDGYDPETYDQLTETGVEYLSRVAGDRDQQQRDYGNAIDSAIDRFEDLRERVAARGIADNTLCLFTSDHGELLGEYGFLGHNHLACPELVYVPTVFAHPTLDGAVSDTTLRHVDLFPIVCSLLGVDVDGERLDGTSQPGSRDRIGYNHFEMDVYTHRYLRGVSHEVRSCWDGSGGHVFVENTYLDSLALYLGLQVSSHHGKEIRRSGAYLSALRRLLPGHTEYGDPGFGRGQARELATVESEPSVAETTSELDESTQERLENLGYL